MARPTITRIRDQVRSLDYAVSLHAAEELEDEKLTILDFENVILTGQIIGRQRDRKTREVKNIIRGQTLDGLEAEAIIKIGPLGSLFIITIYLV